MDKQQSLAMLNSALPCRAAEIEQLSNLLGGGDLVSPFVDSIFIYGDTSVGKSIVLTSVLEKFHVKHVLVNLIECYTPKILFETILHELATTDNRKYAVRCDTMMDFINCLKQITKDNANTAMVLIIDKAERLRQMNFNLLPGLLRLNELTSGVQHITVVFLSTIIFEKYPKTTLGIEPIQIHFPQYNKDELLQILELDFYTDYYRKAQLLFEFDAQFYRNYLNVFLSVFYRACRDLSELRHIARTNFVEYYRPIIDNECLVGDSIGLWRKFAPKLKQSLQVLYLRISDQKAPSQHLELPFYAKYLLIASYLASYNPAKDDKRLFMKYHGKKSKTVRDVAKKSKVSEQLTTQLGAKSFNLDRLLAIFYAILNEQIGLNNNLLVQISSLVQLQLLTTLHDSSAVLDGQKYKCNVNFDFIQSVSKMVGFNIRKYLSDFSHL